MTVKTVKAVRKPVKAIAARKTEEQKPKTVAAAKLKWLEEFLENEYRLQKLIYVKQLVGESVLPHNASKLESIIEELTTYRMEMLFNEAFDWLPAKVSQSINSLGQELHIMLTGSHTEDLE